MPQERRSFRSSGRGARLRAFVFAFGMLVLGVIFFAPSIVSAQLAQSNVNVQQTAAAAGVSGGADLIQILGRIIGIALGFIGIVFLVILLYSGYEWMTAGGDVAKVESAKKRIRNAVIGLILIASAWAITSYILNALTGATGGGSVTGGGGGGIGLISSSGSLGSGLIEYHLPERNATDVPRNTPIIITFKQPVSPASFIDGWTEQSSSTNALNAANMLIFRTGDDATALTSAQARVSFTADRKTYVIRPVEYLGSPTANVKYTVRLKGGNAGLQLDGGGSAFTGAFSSGYEWGFEVSTKVDLTPPKVVSAIPVSGQYPRNAVIQVTFNEAIDPVGASGVFQNGAGFTNIAVRPNAGVGTPLDGEYKISNRYRTVEFLTADKCGVNSCGRDVFCLPPSATLEVTLHAATLGAEPPQAQFTQSGYDGITDVVGNSLDGDGDGTAAGPPADSYVWSFGTSDAIKLTPPKILTTVPDATPGAGQSNRPVDEDVQASFDGLMQASTFTSDAAYIQPSGPGETDPDTFWFIVGMSLLNSQGLPLQPGDIADHAALIMHHRPYVPSGAPPIESNRYNPFLLSDLQDAYQNCFAPASSPSCNGAPNCCNNASRSAECKF